jgi:hypothetical protein
MELGAWQGMAYFTNVGPDSGALKFYAAPGAIDVLESRDDCTRIGTALSVGNDASGVTLWRLTVHGAELPGTWVIVDREFVRPTQCSGRCPHG